VGLPVVDVTPLRDGSDPAGVAAALGEACRTTGFFYVTGHGVPAELLERLERTSAAFFAQDQASKLGVRMELGGRAWRGYFPVGAELTSGRPDLKEGLYFGQDLPADDPRVRAGRPLFGPNLYPDTPGLREAVDGFMAAMTRLGATLCTGLSLSLGLPADGFAQRYTADPLVLFRIFHYPAPAADASDGFGVGEHTDYGLLTILHQDRSGGLEVKTGGRWVAAPPLEGAFVCNLGDMLDRVTGGLYRSTPHRVRNVSGGSRVSFPFFYDPGVDAPLTPVRAAAEDDAATRWDGASVHAFEGTYGDWLLAKVSQVFPQLGDQVL
jgi:polar amino acid transport system ATP-binding protein